MNGAPMLSIRIRDMLSFVEIALTVAANSAASATPPDALIAKEPLFSASTRVPPNMALDLSVEFPTTGAAYRSSTFDWMNTYIGYWDPMTCYTYSTADGYFKRAAPASKLTGGAITCANQWSGNLLNWAASSSIDMLRYAMTGGDRVVDTASNTVLQRAVLQDDFYRSESYFPEKSLTGNLSQLTPLVVANGPNNGDTIYFNSCRDQIFIGSTASGSCALPGTDQKYGPNLTNAFYFARVEVCAAAEGATRTDLCFKYPSGNFKPVGSIQNYSEQMRFSAFGYLLDSVVGRYGGVLRAPMKYTGPQKLDASFNKVVNNASEWDAATGVFNRNPLNSTEPNRNTPLSGVANYLNQFGRTGSNPGTYKGFDPVSELYYESIRYFQGRPPTVNAIAGMTTAMKDGFPVYNNTDSWGQGSQTNWDPVVASCQRNYVLAIGDLNTHRDKSLPGMTKSGSDGDFDRGYNDAIFEPNTSTWTGLVGGFENKESIPYAQERTQHNGQCGAFGIQLQRRRLADVWQHRDCRHWVAARIFRYRRHGLLGQYAKDSKRLSRRSGADLYDRRRRRW
jgi:type IV pilus assembly protein PilY1